MRNSITELLGKTITDINKSEVQIIFTCSTGEQYRMFHSQDCCENVSIDDIEGELEDLIGSPITVAEEVSNPEFEQRYNDSFKENEYGWLYDQNGNSKPESCTWTFYRLATIKGYVTIRWFGESNGYYSESVDFVLIGSDNDY